MQEHNQNANASHVWCRLSRGVIITRLIMLPTQISQYRTYCLIGASQIPTESSLSRDVNTFRYENTPSVVPHFFAGRTQ